MQQPLSLTPDPSTITGVGTSPHAHPSPSMRSNDLLSPPAASRTISGSSLTPPSTITPLLTPNTRTQAEAALCSNSLFQTSAAAPTTTDIGPAAPVLPTGEAGDGGVTESHGMNTTSEATPEKLRSESIGRPAAPPRLASSNYAEAVRAAAAAAAADAIRDVQSAGSMDNLEMGSASGQEVNVIMRQPVRLGRQQSWSVEDMKRMMVSKLLEDRGVQAGYHSTELKI